MQDWAKYGGGPRPTPAPRRLASRPAPGPLVTIPEMVATYRAILPRCAPSFAAVLRDIMVRCVAAGREPGCDDDSP